VSRQLEPLSPATLNAGADQILAAIKEVGTFPECRGNSWLREDAAIGMLIDRARPVPVTSFLWLTEPVELDDPPANFGSAPFVHTARHPEIATTVPFAGTVTEAGRRIMGACFSCDRCTKGSPVAAAAIPQPPGVLLVALCETCHWELANAFPRATFFAVEH
jgi:hypothetical protein